MQWLSDSTGRFRQRPYYSVDELNNECCRVMDGFLLRRHGVVRFPVSTDDLTVLIESEAEDLDLGADLSAEGSNVDGVTEFRPGERPRVKISRRLTDTAKAENRLRSTLGHELGHVLFHRRIYDDRDNLGGGDQCKRDAAQSCREGTLIAAEMTDWMEWQAGFASGAFLLPRPLLFQRLVRFESNSGTSGPFPLNSILAEALVAEISKAFAVSRAAARTRLLVEGVLMRPVPPLIALQMLRKPQTQTGLVHCAATLARISLPLGLTFAEPQAVGK